MAGFIIATAGEAWCFLIDGVSYFAVIMALLADEGRAAAAAAAPAHHAIVRQLLEGWRYVFGFRPIRSLMMLLAGLCLVAMPFSVLMPVFADTMLGGGRAHAGLSDDGIRRRRAERRAVADARGRRWSGSVE